jgi:inner membrane protease subunit 2
MSASARAGFSFNAKDFSRAVFRQSIIALSWLPPIIFFENHLYSIASVEGISMKPTFNPESNLLRRDLVLEDKTWTWRKGSDGKLLIRRGDVVTFKSPLTTKVAVKRVTGVAGDIVKTRLPREGRVVTIPEGHVWYGLVRSNLH